MLLAAKAESCPKHPQGFLQPVALWNLLDTLILEENN